jgi:hypothetical protein
MNKACILKLGRKIQAGAEDFWCEVLVGKYMRTSADGELMAKAIDSHLWKPIIKLWPYLDAYSWWTIRDGKSIKLCQDAWIEDGLRLENCNLPIPDQMRHVNLIDIVDGTGWNWNMLDTWIPPNMKAKIGLQIAVMGRTSRCVWKMQWEFFQSPKCIMPCVTLT